MRACRSQFQNHSSSIIDKDRAMHSMPADLSQSAPVSRAIRNNWRLLAVTCSVLVLAGCTTTGYQKPNMAVPATFAASGQAQSVDNSANRWWLAFRDDRLNKLIARGLGENLDIAQAVERINQANAGMIAAGATMLPGVSLSAGARHGTEGQTPAITTASVGSSASWTLDLFGQYAQSRQLAQANLDGAYFSVDIARLTFLSELSNAYIDLRYYQESLALTRSSLATRRETVALTETLFSSGAGSRLDVLQAQSALDAASMQVPGLELGFIRSLNRLATLTAQNSGALEADLQKGAPQPWPRLKINAGIPADLVRQRPDIQAAERQLAAASAEAGIAEAQLYPSLSLTGNIQLVQMASGSIGSWGFGPALNLPFLDGGRSRANHQVALSKVNQAYNSWQMTVRRAIEETENGLAAVRRDSRSIETAQKVVSIAEQTLGLARESYQAGQGQILDVLNAERALFDAKASMASSTQQYARNYVLLNVAVGGGVAAIAAK